jgi:hypothetical protein
MSRPEIQGAAVLFAASAERLIGPRGKELANNPRFSGAIPQFCADWIQSGAIYFFVH